MILSITWYYNTQYIVNNLFKGVNVSSFIRFVWPLFKAAKRWWSMLINECNLIKYWNKLNSLSTSRCIHTYKTAQSTFFWENLIITFYREISHDWGSDIWHPRQSGIFYYVLFYRSWIKVKYKYKLRLIIKCLYHVLTKAI